ncbi:MAG: flagellar biosynthesis protein [Pseudomonadota bacterium]
MARLLQLETFEMPDARPRGSDFAQAEVEELKLAAYEQGYAAGWDDAVAAQSADVARLRSDLGRNLTEMTLSHRDARRHVLSTLEPLLHEMVAKVLPAIAQMTLGPIVLEQLLPLAEKLSEGPVVVMTAPANRDQVERLLQGQSGLPLRVTEAAALSDGQAYLKVGHSEISVDLDGVVTAIAMAVGAFFQLEAQKE